MAPSRSPTHSIVSLRLRGRLLREQPIESGAADAERGRGGRLVAVESLDHRARSGPLDVVHACGKRYARIQDGSAVGVRQEVLRADRPVAEQERAFDGVAQLAHIAAPRGRRQHVANSGIERWRGHAVELSELLRERIGEDEYVAGTLAQ